MKTIISIFKSILMIIGALVIFIALALGFSKVTSKKMIVEILPTTTLEQLNNLSSDFNSIGMKLDLKSISFQEGNLVKIDGAINCWGKTRLSFKSDKLKKIHVEIQYSPISILNTGSVTVM